MHIRLREYYHEVCNGCLSPETKFPEINRDNKIPNEKNAKYFSRQKDVKLEKK